MASLFDALAGQSNANPDDPTGAYLGNLIDPRTAAQFQAARNQSGDLGFWQGVLQASAPHLGVSGTSPAAAGILGQMQAQNLLPQQALQSAQTGNTAAETLFKRLQAAQLGYQVSNMPAGYAALDQIARQMAGANGAGGQGGGMAPSLGVPGAPASVPGSAPANSMTNPTGSPTYADKVIHWEAGGDPNAVNPQSSATGLGQFLDGTWLNLFNKTNPNNGMSDAQILALRTNPDISRAMINAYGQENAGILAKAGVPVNDATLYGAHWFGPGGAVKIFSASPDTSLASLGFSKNTLALNNLTGGTAGDFANIVSRKMGQGVLTLPGLAQAAQAQATQGSGSSQPPGGANAAPVGATPGAPAGIPAGLAGATPVGGAAPGAPVQLAQAGGNPYAGLGITPGQAILTENALARAGMQVPDWLKGIATLPTERAKSAIQKDLELQYNPAIAGATTGATKAAEAPYNLVDVPVADPANPGTMKNVKIPMDIYKAGPQAINNYLYGAAAPQVAPQAPQVAPQAPMSLPQVPSYGGATGGAPQVAPQVPMVPSMPSPSMGPVPQPGQNLMNMIGGRPTLAPPGTRMSPPGGVPIGTPGAGPVVTPAMAQQMNANAPRASLPVMPSNYVFGPGMAPPPGAGTVSQPAPMVLPQPQAPQAPQAPQMPAGAPNLIPGLSGGPAFTPTQVAPGAPPGMGQFGKPELNPVEQANPYAIWPKMVGKGPGQDENISVPSDPAHPYTSTIPAFKNALDMPRNADQAKEIFTNNGKILDQYRTQNQMLQTGVQQTMVMRDVLSSIQAGTWTQDKATLNAKMKAAGLPQIFDADPGKADIAAKENLNMTYTSLKAAGVQRITNMEVSQAQKANPSTAVQPEADAELLANNLGAMFQQQALIRDAHTAQQNGWRNLGDFQDQWYDANQLSGKGGFVDQARPLIGDLRGMGANQGPNGQNPAMRQYPNETVQLPHGMPSNAQRAPDGNYYIPGPDGKGYLKLVPKSK